MRKSGRCSALLKGQKILKTVGCAARTDRHGAAALDIHVYRGTFSFDGFFPTRASMHIVERTLRL